MRVFTETRCAIIHLRSPNLSAYTLNSSQLPRGLVLPLIFSQRREDADQTEVHSVPCLSIQYLYFSLHCLSALEGAIVIWMDTFSTGWHTVESKWVRLRGILLLPQLSDNLRLGNSRFLFLSACVECWYDVSWPTELQQKKGVKVTLQSVAQTNDSQYDWQPHCLTTLSAGGHILMCPGFRSS